MLFTKLKTAFAVCFSSSRIVSGVRDGCTLLNPIWEECWVSVEQPLPFWRGD